MEHGLEGRCHQHKRVRDAGRAAGVMWLSEGSWAARGMAAAGLSFTAAVAAATLRMKRSAIFFAPPRRLYVVQ